MSYHPELERIARGLKALHARWTPHSAQVEIGRALLGERKKEVFAQCGRNLGKSELTGYLMWRWAWTFPGSENYYFSPYMKQSREIMWASRRIQEFGPKEWITKINEQEMRIYFQNGSFIKLDGSDNVEAYRGVKPKGLTVFDEFKDFRPEFYEAYDPNRAAHDTPLFIIGTPPEFECQFTHVANSWSQDPNKAFFKFPTSANPHISRDWLEKKKAELYSRGEGDKWEREYMAEFVRGGASRIFPMLNSSLQVLPHTVMLHRIAKDRRKLSWYAWADPAGASCFAVLFVAINPYTREVFVLDEIYETSQAEMTVIKIGERIQSIVAELAPKAEWRYGYDEAEAWFRNEMLNHFELPFEPTSKAKHDKLSGLSLIKDMLLKGKLYISDRCKKLFWEMDQYRKDSNGRIPKLNDHAIDCLRYVLDADHYALTESVEYLPEHDEMFRGRTISQDFPGMSETGEPVDEWEQDTW